MKSSILVSVLFAAYLQPAFAAAASCNIANSNIEKCFSKAAPAASSFCSSFVAAPTPVVAGFDCVTKHSGEIYASSSIASLCSCYSATAVSSVKTSTSAATCSASVSISVTTSYITVVQTATTTAPTVTVTQDCSSSTSTSTSTSTMITSTFTSTKISSTSTSTTSTTSVLPVPTPASLWITTYTAHMCTMNWMTDGGQHLVEGVCKTFGAGSVAYQSFVPGNLCSSDATAASCTLSLYNDYSCSSLMLAGTPSTEGACLSNYSSFGSAKLTCGC